MREVFLFISFSRSFRLKVFFLFSHGTTTNYACYGSRYDYIYY